MALTLKLFGVGSYIPFGVIGPVFDIVAFPKVETWRVPNSMRAEFGGTLALQGYAVRDAAEGRGTIGKLYWEASRPSNFDYSAFVHLVDESGQLLAQKDHAPGADRHYPPS